MLQSVVEPVRTDCTTCDGRNKSELRLFDWQLTDQSVQYLSGVCHYLKELDMSGCVLLT